MTIQGHNSGITIGIFHGYNSYFGGIKFRGKIGKEYHCLLTKREVKKLLKNAGATCIKKHNQGG